MASTIAAPQFVEEYGQGDRANRWYRCVLTEGKNREIRKLFDHFGCVVNRLVRLQYGPFILGDIAAGDIREVPPGKVKEFLDYLAKQGRRRFSHSSFRAQAGSPVNARKLTEARGC